MVKNIYIKKALKTNMILAKDIIAQILEVSKEELRMSSIIFFVFKKWVIYDYVTKHRDNIPKSTSYEKTLSDSMNMPEENILLELEDLGESLVMAIENGWDLKEACMIHRSAEKILKNIEIQIKIGNIKIIGEWKDRDTEIITPIEEVLALFADSDGETTEQAIPIAIEKVSLQENAFIRAEVFLRQYEIQLKQRDTTTARRVRNYMHKLNAEIAKKCGIKSVPSANLAADNQRAINTDLPKLKRLFPDFPDLC